MSNEMSNMGSFMWLLHIGYESVSLQREESCCDVTTVGECRGEGGM